MFHKKDLMGQIQASVSSYICIRVLSFFLCYNKGNHTRDAMFLPVCAHLYTDVSVYPRPVNIITINYIVLCYIYVFICLL